MVKPMTKRSQVPLLIAILILFAPYLQLTSTFTITPNEIKDLFPTDETSFAADASYWTLWPGYLTPTCCNKIYTWCGSTLLLGGWAILGPNSANPKSYGGYGAYFQRTYTGLGPHTMIYFSMQFWAIDSWDLPSDSFRLSFSGSVVSGFVLDLNTFTTNVCGNSNGDWRELKMVISGQAVHSSSTLVFQVITGLDETSDNESFGFRELSFVMYNGAPTSNSLCAVGSTNSGSLCYGNCGAGKYYSSGCKSCHVYCSTCYGGNPDQCYDCNKAVGAIWDGSKCSVCHPTCATCFGSGADQCITCSGSGGAYYLFNNNQCLTSCSAPLVLTYVSPNYICKLPCTKNQYLYPQTPAPVCGVTCDFPFRPGTTSTVAGIVNTCNSPCSVGQYLYWDGSCTSACNSPLVVQSTMGISQCTTTCSTTMILYWNGDCEATCPFPLDYANRFSRKFCDFPCTYPTYLYNNGSCIATCDSRFTSTYSRSQYFCNYPCASNYYLYNNGDCKSTCDVRFMPYKLYNDLYCDFPCTAGQYLYTNGSCISTCDVRFTERVDAQTGDKYCDYPCSSSQYLYSNGSCFTSCDVNFNPYYLWQEKYCDHPCPTGQYLLNNGTCVTSCPTYFLPTTTTKTVMPEGVVINENLCNYPCVAGEFLYSNGTCHDYCQRHFVPIAYSTNKFCNYPCTSSEYLYRNGTCSSTCPSTFIASPSHPPTNEKVCNFPCNPSAWLYDNGTCLSACLPPYVQKSYGSDNYCSFPCNTGQFLYKDGSCKTSCNAPYVSRTYGLESFCDYPCQTDHYLYYNNTCLSSCKSPFIKRVTNQYNYCDYPCASLSDFIYWNNTCSPTCPSPLQSYNHGTSHFCRYPCQLNQYLYWDGVCRDNCTYPLVSSNISGVAYCNNACTSTEYLYWNGSCISTCDAPFRVQDSGLGARCALPCDKPEQYYHENTQKCINTCDGNSKLVDGLYLNCKTFTTIATEFLDFISTPPIKPNTLTFVVLASPIRYLKHLDIKIPSRLGRLIASEGKSPIALQYIYEVPNQILSEFSSSTNSRILSESKTQTSFIINFWPNLVSMAIVLIAALLFKAAEYTSSKFALDEFALMFKRLKIIMKWNFVVILLSNGLGDVIYYSSLEFQEPKIYSALTLISFGLCLIFIILEIAMLAMGYFMASRALNVKATALKSKSYEEYKLFLNKWEGFQVLYRGFKEHSKFGYFFFLFYTIRLALPMLIAACLDHLPFVQVIILLVINVTAILYIFLVGPLRKKINQFQLIIGEFLMLTANAGLLALIVLDFTGADAEQAKEIIGDIIVVCSFCIILLPLVFLCIKLAFGAMAAYGLRKKYPKQSRALWLQLIWIPVQQAGMGFEQVQVAPFSTEHPTKIMKHSELKSLDSSRIELTTKKFEDPEQTLNIKEPAKFGSNMFAENEIQGMAEGYYPSPGLSAMSTDILPRKVSSDDSWYPSPILKSSMHNVPYRKTSLGMNEGPSYESRDFPIRKVTSSSRVLTVVSNKTNVTEVTSGPRGYSKTRSGEL